MQHLIEKKANIKSFSDYNLDSPITSILERNPSLDKIEFLAKNGVIPKLADLMISIPIDEKITVFLLNNFEFNLNQLENFSKYSRNFPLNYALPHISFPVVKRMVEMKASVNENHPFDALVNIKYTMPLIEFFLE